MCISVLYGTDQSLAIRLPYRRLLILTPSFWTKRILHKGP